MYREATQTIKGFMYQFHKTLLSLLDASPSDRITVEGYVEDIDILTDKNFKAIQCKYYESKSGFELSSITEPVLQMMCSAINDASVEFELYLYFNGCNEGTIDFTEEMLETLLKTENKDYKVRFFFQIFEIDDIDIRSMAIKPRKSDEEKKQICEYFKNNITKLKRRISNVEFLKRITITSGASYSQIQRQVKNELGIFFDKEDVELLLYPNAFNYIANLSTLPNLTDRTIGKSDLFDFLRDAKKLLHTKWTKLILSEDKILKRKIKELSPALQQNSRKRILIFDVDSISDFANKADSFINDYIKLYYEKPKLQIRPCFILKTTDMDVVNNIEKKLFERKIIFNNGNIGGEVEFELLFDEEFNPKAKLQLCRYCVAVEEYICAYQKPDDIYIFGNINANGFINRGFNVESFDLDNLVQINQLLKMKGV